MDHCADIQIQHSDSFDMFTSNLIWIAAMLNIHTYIPCVILKNDTKTTIK